MIDEFIMIVAEHDDAMNSVATVLSRLYNEYEGKIEFNNSIGFNRDGDEIGKPILSPESWFESVLDGTL